MAESNTKLILWGAGTGRTMRPHWGLHELGLDYESRPIGPRTGETKTTEYTRLNPRQKVPTLQDGDFTIAESAAILAYLADSYGSPGRSLAPSGARERARWLEWCFYVVTELDATSLYVMRRHGDLKHIYGDAPVAMACAATYFATLLRHAALALEDGRRFLLGDQFSSADILLTTTLTWAISYKQPLPRSCEDYVARLTARPAYRAASIANRPVPPPA